MVTSSDSAGSADVDPPPAPPTGEQPPPGAHPVGTSLGAVGAGAAGAALGAVGGPIGVVVGAIVGAVAGAIIGKETAETVNPMDPETRAHGHRADEETHAVTPTPPAFPAIPEPLGSIGGSPDPLLQSVAAASLAPTLHAEPVDRDVPPLPSTPMPPSSTPMPPMISALTAAAAAAPATPGNTARPSGRLQRISAGTRPLATSMMTATPPLPPPMDLIVQESYPEENVRDAAYFRYLRRVQHGLEGDELTDWTGAEQEVLRG